jgi:hypothetical protein
LEQSSLRCRVYVNSLSAHHCVDWRKFAHNFRTRNGQSFLTTRLRFYSEFSFISFRGFTISCWCRFWRIFMTIRSLVHIFFIVLFESVEILTTRQGWLK